MSAYSDQAVELALTLIPPSFRRSRSTSSHVQRHFSIPVPGPTKSSSSSSSNLPLFFGGVGIVGLATYVYLGDSVASFSTAAAPSTRSPSLQGPHWTQSVSSTNQSSLTTTIPRGSSSSFQKAALRSLPSPHSSSCARSKAPMVHRSTQRVILLSTHIHPFRIQSTKGSSFSSSRNTRTA